MPTPEKIKYTKDHEWISDDGIVGISDHAQNELGDVVFVELPKKGTKVEKGKEIAVLESVKAVSNVYSPVDGVITEINEVLSQKPELINQKPFDEGWIAKIEIKDKNQLNDLMSFEEYQSYIKK